jgi:hypothetical protein
MLEELFKFPVVMVDGDNEERKFRQKAKLDALGMSNSEEEDEDYDVIEVEAEYPYWNVVGIEDRWLPTRKSFTKAMEGRFEACLVRFTHGVYTVPWTKKKFKAELLKFAEEYKAANKEEQIVPKLVKIKTVSKEDYEKIVGDGTDK